MEKIKVKEKEKFKKEDFLLHSGGRFNLRTGTDEYIKFDREIPTYSACFQISRKYYRCGGKRKINQ